MATSLIIESTDSNGKAVSKAYPCMKETATDAELRDFGTKLNAFSDHTLDNIYRVDKNDITFDPRDPRFTISPSSLSMVGGDLQNQTITVELSYLGEERTPKLSGQKPSGGSVTVVDKKTVSITTGIAAYGGPDSASFTITLPATADYDKATATFTFTNADTSKFVNI